MHRSPSPSSSQKKPQKNSSRPFNRENKFVSLQKMFPEVPAAFINKVLSELIGEENVKRAIAQESFKIQQTTSKDWVKTYYKAFPCSDKELCKHSDCLYYHSLCERRRVYKYFKYNPIICPQASQCPRSDKCESAHTINEVLYHPFVYASEICPYMKLKNFCVYGKICPFFHEANDEDQVFNEYIQLHELLGEVSKELVNIDQEIASKLKKEEDLKQKRKCKCGNIKEFIRVPCGHGSCYQCSQSNNCPVCNISTNVYKIEFN
jgi:hypothetical protein